MKSVENDGFPNKSLTPHRLNSLRAAADYSPEAFGRQHHRASITSASSVFTYNTRILDIPGRQEPPGKDPGDRGGGRSPGKDPGGPGGGSPPGKEPGGSGGGSCPPGWPPYRALYGPYKSKGTAHASAAPTLRAMPNCWANFGSYPPK